MDDLQSLIIKCATSESREHKLSTIWQTCLTFCQTCICRILKTCICRTVKGPLQTRESAKEANICKNFNPILTFAPGTRRRTDHHSVAGFVYNWFVYNSSRFDTPAIFFNI